MEGGAIPQGLSQGAQLSVWLLAFACVAAALSLVWLLQRPGAAPRGAGWLGVIALLLFAYLQLLPGLGLSHWTSAIAIAAAAAALAAAIWLWAAPEGATRQLPAAPGLAPEPAEPGDPVELRQQLTACEAARAKAEADLEQYAYLVSHDLQEPLRMVVGFSQLLMRRHGPDLPEQAREYAEMSAASAQRMSDMLKELLTLSRVGRAELGEEPVDLNLIWERTTRALAGQISETRARVEAGQLPTVIGSPELFGRLLQNLLSNALTYHGAQPPRVWLSAERDREGWRISMDDQGIGLDEKFAERIFQPFQRLHTQNEYPGVGMGLAVARRIVERYGGRIWGESRPGQGARFVFVLPAEVD